MKRKFFTLLFVTVALWKLFTFPVFLERVFLAAERDLLQLQRALIRVQTCRTQKTPPWTRKYQIPLKLGQGWYGWPPDCIRLVDLEPTSIELHIHMLQEKTRFVCDLYEEGKGFVKRKFLVRFQKNSCLHNGSYESFAETPTLKFMLQPQMNYKIVVRGTSKSDTCSFIFSTPGDNKNWIKDPTFQVFGTPLFRHWLGLSSTRTLKYWLPLFSNGYVIEPCSSNRSCGLILGNWQTSTETSRSLEKPAFFGVLQPIWIPNNFSTNISSLYIEMSIESLSDPLFSNCLMIIYGTNSQRLHQNFVLSHVCQEDLRNLILQVKLSEFGKFLYLALVKNASSANDAVKILNIRVRPRTEFASDMKENIQKQSFPINSGSESIFVIARWRKPRKGELTIAIPLSIHRMFTLKELLKFYKTGPVVAVIAIQNEQEKNALLKYLSLVPNHMRMNVEFVVVFMSPWQDRFPINRLRNIALNYTTTDFVCVLDVDTFPISSSFAIFPQIIEREPELLPMNSKRCLVLANWMAADSEQLVYPSLYDLKSKYLKTWFPYCKASQSPISFRRWLYENHSFFVSFQPNFEPYCVMRTRDFILFDERFSGYGFNKVSWALEATLQGVEFLVDNRFFLVHKDHPTQNAESSFQYFLNWITYYTFVNEKLLETIE